MNSLPDTWKLLLDEPDEMSAVLAGVIAAKAEKHFGQKPPHSHVLDFLRTLKGTPSKPRMKSTPQLKSGRKGFYESQTNLDVRMADGEHIRHENGIDTFRQVISKLGGERCAPYDPYIVKHRRDLPKSVRKPILIDGHYVECGGPTKQRKERLEHIARGLRIQITVNTPRK